MPMLIHKTPARSEDEHKHVREITVCWRTGKFPECVYGADACTRVGWACAGVLLTLVESL